MSSEFENALQQRWKNFSISFDTKYARPIRVYNLGAHVYTTSIHEVEEVYAVAFPNGSHALVRTPKGVILMCQTWTHKKDDYDFDWTAHEVRCLCKFREGLGNIAANLGFSDHWNIKCAEH